MSRKQLLLLLTVMLPITALMITAPIDSLTKSGEFQIVSMDLAPQKKDIIIDYGGGTFRRGCVYDLVVTVRNLEEASLEIDVNISLPRLAEPAYLDFENTTEMVEPLQPMAISIPVSTGNYTEWLEECIHTFPTSKFTSHVAVTTPTQVLKPIAPAHKYPLLSVVVASLFAVGFAMLIWRE